MVVEKIPKEWYSGHRGRLRKKFLEDKISESELLELLLTYAIPRVDVKPLVRHLLMKFGNVHEVTMASIRDLCAFHGLKINTAVFLKLIHKVVLLDYKHHLSENPLFNDIKKLENYCLLLLMNKKQEEFHVLYLDKNKRLLLDEVHSVGTVDNVGVYPREVLHRALEVNANFVLLVHNHPDGNRFFSEQDISVTMEIINVLHSTKIEVIDHFLVSDGMIFSASSSHLLR
ncbi:MAG: DNA repair protein RadC [Rickettsiales bacterium]|nr:DNA repair protein RadC [Rickettsiales bacterium]